MKGPGFVDLQANGLSGISFTEPGLTLNDVRAVTETLANKGTVAYCPTITTTAVEVYRENLSLLATAMEDPALKSHLLGINLEGPFISSNPGAIGANYHQYVRPPSVEFLEQLQTWARGRIRFMTIAPEQPGIEAVIRRARELEITVSLGHHLADESAMADAVTAGASCCTHLGNGLPNLIRRHQNPLWFQFSCDDLYCTMVTDGIYVPASLLKTALRAKTVERFVVITDLSVLYGFPPGKYAAYGKQVEVQPNGRIFCSETQGLAGSSFTMLESLNYLASLNILSEDELWQVGCFNPLRVLRLEASVLDGVSGRHPRFVDGQFVL